VPAEDLRAFADLAGDREETAETRDADGVITSTSTRRVPVISPAMLAGLPSFQAMLLRRGMPVALVHTPIAWKRRDVRRAHRTAPKFRTAVTVRLARLRRRVQPARTPA
jgi:type IV secretion system protein VirD4